MYTGGTLPDSIKSRFRGFYPVIVDLETAGFNPKTNALLEVAAVLTELNEQGELVPGECLVEYILPFEGAVIDPEALEFNKIDPYHPFRMAKPEAEAIDNIFSFVREAQKRHACQRSVLVGHNAHFDHSFLFAAERRCQAKRNPFHPFTMFDTATLGGLAYGQTVLAKALSKAKIDFDEKEAHAAKYDAYVTAKLFCQIVNAWDSTPLKP